MDPARNLAPRKILALKDSSAQDLKEVPWAVFEIFLSKIYKRSK
jgi:hypothetical protein